MFFSLLYSRRSTYIRLSKIFVQGPKSHVHNYFGNPQLHSAWSVSPGGWDYNIMCRERREMSRNDIDAVENMPDEDPPTPTETILDPWEMAFCPSTRTKVCFHTIIFRLDHNTFYTLLFFYLWSHSVCSLEPNFSSSLSPHPEASSRH